MTAQSVRAPLPLVESFDSVAERCRGSTALVEGGVSVTFETLAERIAALEAAFRDVGIGPGRSVALLLPNGSSFAVAAFATWRVGATLVPLHVRFLEREILRYVSDCGVSAVVATQRMSSMVDLVRRQDGRVKHAWLWPSARDEPDYVGKGSDAGGEAVDPDPGPTGDDWPAVTQYSTGSTGFSKRVTRSHGQMLREATALSELFGLGPEDRMLGVSPFFHSYGLGNVLLAGLLSGTCIHAVNDFFPRDVAALIEGERITAFPGVPFMYQLLSEAGAGSDFSSIRYALSAGAPLSPETAEAFRERTGVRIRQLYGTTETGAISVEREGADPSEPSVGHPIPGVSVEIRDDRGRVLVPGQIGNVAVSSPFAGKYDHPERSGESVFRDDAFLPGDLGKLERDGRLVLAGRRRGFVNVAGNKVDPAEVEAVLKQMAAVSEAVVVGVPDGAADEKVKAVIVAAEPCTRADVYAHCSSRLADFKRPRLIEFRKELPRSPLGKVLRKYLIDDASVGEGRYVFSPRGGFSLQEESGSEVPATPDLSTVSPFLRTLLVTDGTVTKSLEAYFWEPIDVELILHVESPSERDVPEIEVDVGDPVLKRRVVLRGHVTHSAYAFCEAVTACDRLAPSLRRTLVEGNQGIGELIREWRWETYRELIEVGRAEAGEWSGYLEVSVTAKVAVRRYRISHEGRPLIQITEVFPENRFESFV
jgi:long-chain acyl-CoA synthetase